MSSTALRIIRDEHSALAAMLRSLSMIVADARRKREMPDFQVIRSMLFYIDEFPERLHHTKESELLFPLVRERAPELAPTLERLEADHERGERAVRDLGHELLAFEVLGEARRDAFDQALQQYTRDYLEHMSVEEREILPAAQKCLTGADWAALDRAFEANRDPLTGHTPDDIYKPLFERIVMTTKAPYGLA